jgi:glyceraldehyde 3-phosphate dehydrogenase (phosphorylating)
MPLRLAINGCGRTGRMVLRSCLERREVELVALNDVADAATIAHLVAYDSVHGRLPAEVRLAGGALEIGGRTVVLPGVKDPAGLPWRQLGVDLVVEATGKFTDAAKAVLHLEAGAKRVVIAAPAKGGNVPTFVMGVNHERYDPARDRVVSNASCTTNCLAPVAKVLLEEVGIRHGQVTTVHAYTNAQQLLDGPNKDLRRARAATLSMVPTSTGAAKALGRVLPQLEGRLGGMAIRVPTPNVSLIDLVIEAERTTSVEKVNAAMRRAAQTGLRGILEVSHAPLVSADFNHTSASSIVDAPSTSVVDGTLVKVLAWYDNEWAYACRVVDLAMYMSTREA